MYAGHVVILQHIGCLESDRNSDRFIRISIIILINLFMFQLEFRLTKG